MLLHDFSERAQEYIRLAEHARSRHDRDLFIGMALAWYGLAEDPPEQPAASRQPH